MVLPGAQMIRGINHVTFSVKRIRPTVDFYVKTLGARLAMISGNSAYVVLGGVWIAFVLDPGMKRPEGYTHLAFHVPPRSFKAFAARIARSGAEIWQQNETEGDSIYFCDPSGNRLEGHASTLKKRLAAIKEKPRWGARIAPSFGRKAPRGR